MKTATSIFTMNIRVDHSVDVSIIGKVSPNTTMRGEEIWSDNSGELWLHITDYGGKSVNGWVAIIHEGVVLCTLFSDAQYARLKHQHDLDGKSILEHHGKKLLQPNENKSPVGVPSVFRGINAAVKNNSFCWFTKEWQLFSFELIKWNIRRQKPWYKTEAWVIESAKKIFRAGYRGDAFQSNKKYGSEYGADYVNGSNLNRKPMRLEYQFTGGNRVLILGDKKKVTGGYTAYPVRCFNGLLPPPQITDIDPAADVRILWATIETRKLKDGNDREVRPFDLCNVGVSGFPYFIICNGSDTIWIPEDRIKMITPEQALINNPYD